MAIECYKWIYSTDIDTAFSADYVMIYVGINAGRQFFDSANLTDCGAEHD